MRKSAVCEDDRLANKLRDGSLLSRTVDEVAIQFEPCIVEDEINSSVVFLAPVGLNSIPNALHIVAENVLLSGS